MTAQEYYDAFAEYLENEGYNFGINPQDKDPTVYVIIDKYQNGKQITNLDNILISFTFKDYIAGEVLLMISGSLYRVNIDTYENYAKAVARVNRMNCEDSFFDYYDIVGDTLICNVVTYLPNIEEVIRQLESLYNNCVEGFYMSKFAEL